MKVSALLQSSEMSLIGAEMVAASLAFQYQMTSNDETYFLFFFRFSALERHFAQLGERIQRFCQHFLGPRAEE